MLEVQTLFKKHFGFTPTHLVQAPGRLELIGNHTDYNDGLVMALAVDRYIYIASSPRSDGKVELVSSAFPEKDVFSAHEFKKNPAAPWANYLKGVLDQLHKRGVHSGGFNAAIQGTIPLGAGMSSSAALEVATALTVRQLYPYALTDTGCTTPPARDREGQLPPLSTQDKLRIAKVCQAAENQYVGVNCGLLDQISSLFGKEAHAIEIDCQSLAVELEPLIGDIAVIVCNTGVKHELVGGEYNALRRNCEGAAKALGVKSLRSADPKMVEAAKGKLAQREYECARHVVTEIQRVVFGARALRDGDLRQFGQYMFQSHESSRDSFKNSVKELDTLVELARKHPGCIGARLTGGGFGGATINLVERPQAADFMQSVVAGYEKQYGVKLQPLTCQIVDGAR